MPWINLILCEGRVIQSCLKRKSSARNDTQVTRSFIKLMFVGNARAALRLLMSCDHGTVLSQNDPVDSSNPDRLVCDVLRATYHNTHEL